MSKLGRLKFILSQLKLDRMLAYDLRDFFFFFGYEIKFIDIVVRGGANVGPVRAMVLTGPWPAIEFGLQWPARNWIFEIETLPHPQSVPLSLALCPFPLSFSPLSH